MQYFHGVLKRNIGFALFERIQCWLTDTCNDSKLLLSWATVFTTFPFFFVDKGIQKAYIYSMKTFRWDPRKEELLKETRCVSFEQVRNEIVKGRFKAENILLITIFPSPNWHKKLGGKL